MNISLLFIIRFGKMSCSYDELPTSVRNSLTRLVSQIKTPLNTTETFFILSGLNGMGTSWQLVEEEICQYLSRNLLYNIPNYNMGVRFLPFSFPFLFFF